MKNDSFKIVGGKKLYGEVINQTSKNATLPIMSACLLSAGDSVIKEYPNITDVDNMIKILKRLGASVKKENNNLVINTNNVTTSNVDCKLSKTMRSSVFLLGSLLGRFKTACITMPGGCNIGKRPIDIHVSALKKLKVNVSAIGENYYFSALKARAGKVRLRFPSVGATENLVQFCSTLKGKSVILNAAREPEVEDLCNFLNKMGAKILGAGTNKITIYGVDRGEGRTNKQYGDRIVAGTIATAVAMCGGDVTIRNACPYQNLKFIEKLASMGCQIDYKNDILHIVQNESLLSFNEITTGCYPNFPTDLQSVMLTASTFAKGKTVIKENLFENRFLIVEELLKMGASITTNGNLAEVDGVQCLKGAAVEAKDLRGGAALVLAGLAAKGETIVNNVHFIDRGYVKFEQVLSKLGAIIKRE